MTIHKIILAFLLNILLWIFIKTFIVEISIVEFFIIEILMSLFEIFLNFVLSKNINKSS